MQASHELRPSKMANEPSFDLFISGDLQSISIGVIATEKELFKYTVIFKLLKNLAKKCYLNISSALKLK